MSRKASVMTVVVLLGIGIWISNSQGEEYPIRPIELICPYSAGSTVDIVDRLLAETAKKYLGQPVVVINKPGAGGSLAAAEVINTKADGYKLIHLSNLFFATTTKTQRVPFDPTHLVPLANIYEAKHVFAVKGDSPWETLDDLLDYGRKNPAKLRWAHVGRGVAPHLYGTLMFRKAGIETIDIPYKGTPEQVSAVLGGHVDISVLAYGAVKDLLKTGKLKPLVVFSERRYSDLPNVPSVAERGFQEAAELQVLFGLYVHKNTPDPVMKILIDSFRKTQEDPEFRKAIERLGEEPRFLGPELMREAIEKAERVGIPILKELGLYIKQK